MSNKLFIKYSLERDAENWIYKIVGDERGFLPLQEIYSYYPVAIIEGLKKTKNKKDALDFMIKKIESYPNAEYKFLAINEEIKMLEKIWKVKEKEFFDILSKILKAPIYINSFTACFSTFPLCRYNEKESYFTLSFWPSIPGQINTIAHELLHLQFLAVYRKNLEKSGLTGNQIQHLKEALTFLLNEKDFKKILLMPDKGYLEHKDFRKELKDIWDKEKDFHLFLAEAIKLTKKQINKT